MKTKDVFCGIAYMSLGTIAAQSINILVQPILTRIVAPEILGVYSYIISLASIVIPIASLKLDMLIVSLEDDSEVQYMTDVSIILVIIVSLFYLLFVYCTNNLFHIGIFKNCGNLIYLVPFIILTNGIRFVFLSYNNHYKEYEKISCIGIIREGSRAVIQLLMGFLKTDALGQVIGYILSPMIGIRYQSKEYFGKLTKRNVVSLSILKKLVFDVGIRQIKYLVPAQFINSFASSLIIISIASLYTASSVGYYSVATRILDIPIIFITANVSKVIYRQISESVVKGDRIMGIIKTIMIYLSIISISGFGVLYVIAPWISKLVFGNGYEVSGEYLRCLCMMNAIRFIATSFAGLFTVFKKQHYELCLNILLIMAGGLAYSFSYKYNYDIIRYLWTINWTYTFIYFGMLSGYLYLSYNHDKKLNFSIGGR